MICIVQVDWLRMTSSLLLRSMHWIYKPWWGGKLLIEQSGKHTDGMVGIVTDMVMKKKIVCLLLVCFGVKWSPEDVLGSRRILGFLQVCLKKIKNMKWLFSLCLALFLFSEYEAYRSVELHMPAFDNPNFYFLFC